MTSGRLWAFRAALFFAIPASTARGRSERQWPPVPTSPVGHFEITQYRYETDSRGVERSRIQAHLRIAIDFRADHTFRYAWTNAIEPGKDEGSLDGTWRTRDGAGWALVASNDPGAERHLTVSGVPPKELQSVPFVMPGTWFFPAVDPGTARLTDTVITNQSPRR